MSYSCCSGTSSLPHGDHLQYPRSSCGSFYPRHLVHSTNVYSPRICQQRSSLHSACHDTCFQPIRCHTSQAVRIPCRTSCYRPSVSRLCSPCQTPPSSSQGCGPSSCHSLGYGSRSSYSVSCGSSGFRPCGLSSLGYGSGFCRPSCLPSRTFQSSCYRPSCGYGSRFY